MNNYFVLISGCSGGGKTALLEALETQGFKTVPEPGRRIVTQQVAVDGKALPWIDLKKFALRAIEVSKADLVAMKATDEIVFFDRGIVDAAVALEHAGGNTYREVLGSEQQYSKHVFIAPPWSEIFTKDAERRHSFESAKEEYQRLIAAFEILKYDICELPKVSVHKRVEFILKHLGVQ